MKLFDRLRYQKTRHLTNDITVNATGTVALPYGRGAYKVGGRGGSGNPNTPGTVAGYNPPLMYGTSQTVTINNANSSQTVNNGNWGPSPSQPDSYSYSTSSQYVNISYTQNGTNSGTKYYNSTVPGTAGTPVTLGGVTLPGGAIGSLAPVVAPSPSNLTYNASGVSVTVPPGSYVAITPI
jgi:hypothetical protein